MAMASRTSPWPTRLNAHVSILLVDGTGQFQTPPQTSTLATALISVSMGDFNGDGKQDLAAANDHPRRRVDLIGRWRRQFQRSPQTLALAFILSQ